MYSIIIWAIFEIQPKDLSNRLIIHRKWTIDGCYVPKITTIKWTRCLTKNKIHVQCTLYTHHTHHIHLKSIYNLRLLFWFFFSFFLSSKSTHSVILFFSSTSQQHRIGSQSKSQIITSERTRKHEILWKTKNKNKIATSKPINQWNETNYGFKRRTVCQESCANCVRYKRELTSGFVMPDCRTFCI